MLKKSITLMCLGASSVILTACNSVPSAYNGVTGYQVLQQDAQSAQLRYTLAARRDQAIPQGKLQAACQKVLGRTKPYKIEILTVQEIANPQQNRESYGVNVPNTKATFALSNTQAQFSNDDIATRQALQAKPSTLNAVVYRCS